MHIFDEIKIEENKTKEDDDYDMNLEQMLNIVQNSHKQRRHNSRIKYNETMKEID